jgi:uncharacterized membrane protein
MIWKSWLFGVCCGAFLRQIVSVAVDYWPHFWSKSKFKVIKEDK